MQQKQLFYIQIQEDGRFENISDKILYVDMGSVVRIILNLKSSEYYPLLFMRKMQRNIKQKLNPTEKALKRSVYSLVEPQLPILFDQKSLENAVDVFQMGLDEQGDYFVEIEMVRPGSQFFKIVYVKDKEIVRMSVSNYFVVSPQVKLQSYTIQTLLPYSLGPFNEWRAQIESQLKVGYRSFHFPPIQQLGKSGSLYSIQDQCLLNQDLLKDTNLEELSALFKELNQQYKALFFIDILLNHTSYDSEWLNRKDMINATYHVGNSPHLACAVELDVAIGNFSNALGNKQIQKYQKGNEISTEKDVDEIIHILEHDVIYPLNLQEYFLMDVDKVINEIQNSLNHKLKQTEEEVEESDDDNIFIKTPKELLQTLLTNSVINKGHARFGVSVNIQDVMNFLKQQINQYYYFKRKDDNWKQISAEYLKSQLQRINQESLIQATQFIKQAIEATKGQLKYLKLEVKDNVIIQPSEKGDKLVPRYFTHLRDGRYVANNGWIGNYDPLSNFAENINEHHYFRRSIVIWGDLVKLRYGDHKKDSPALWNYMKKYIKMMSLTFHGLRLDNAHSTPRHVGEYMMRKARQANEQILVFAELFAGSPDKDALFCKQFGLNALVREINRCADGQSVHGSLHYFSGNGLPAIGSLPEQTMEIKGKVYKNLRASSAPSLLYEQSHDNETLIHSHGFKHQLPIAALIAFAKCMKGTVRGFDDYLEHRLSVVEERRQYHLTTLQENISKENETVDVVFRLDLNVQDKKVQIRGSFDGWKNGHNLSPAPELKVAKGTYVYTTVLHLPVGQYEYRYLVDEQWYNVEGKERNSNGNHTVDVLKERVTEYQSLCEVRSKLCSLSEQIEEQYPYIHVSSHYNSVVEIVRASQDFQTFKVIIAQPQFSEYYPYPIIELPGEIQSVDYIWLNEDVIKYNSFEPSLVPSQVKIIEQKFLRSFADIYYNPEKRSHVLRFVKFPISLVVVLTCRQEKTYAENIKKIEEVQTQVYDDCFSQLDTNDINFLLFSTDGEERERCNHGLYHIPNYGSLVYGGFYGVLKPINDACNCNNLGHPLFENLRNGNWLIDYLSNRLENLQSESSQNLKKYINTRIQLIKQLPRYLIPKFFVELVQLICLLAKKRINEHANPLVRKAPFLKELSVAGYQFIAHLKSAAFDPFKYTMSAGHPHFTTGWARVWGRDCFIALNGVLLANNLVDEARQIIVQFASCVRHGLMPNLLDSGRNPRYNNRDACWWFMKAMKEYLHQTKDYQLLSTQVQMRFLDDDIDKNEQLKDAGQRLVLPMYEIMQSIYQKHALGIQFREWKAGKEIDNDMVSDGHNINLKLDVETGFIIGGNWRNCLTWMDKMGSSEEAKNKGYPATSRDGAPIEMTALLKLGLDLIIDLNKKGLYPYDSVILGNNQKLLFTDWSNKIQNNFEKNYWVPADLKEQQELGVDTKHKKRQLIYKDICFSSKPRTEYQLRCNACIAIAIAPELFTKEKAIQHIKITQEVLIQTHSLGIKTLDIEATEYVPYYDNADYSNNFKTSRGFSYHNGPEWVWVYGYFLKAIINVQILNKHQFYSYLSNHKKFLFENEWYSLPEMTNHNGEYNHFSCRAQAWSIGCILEAIIDYENQNRQS